MDLQQLAQQVAAEERARRERIPQRNMNDTYRHLIALARGVNDLSRMAQLPTALTAMTMVDDPAQQNQIMEMLQKIQLLSSLPVTMDDAHLVQHAMHHSPNRMDALQELLPYLGGETLMRNLPLLLRSAGNHF